MSRHLAQPHPPALVIGGMHRSTTSLAASILADAGLHLGDHLVAADSGNPHGHFEDVEFHLLLRRILAANGLSEEGFTSADRIDVPAPARDEAAALVARRRGAGRLWGWKDPQTVLFLDFWAGLLPEARWLFVVRPPCEVVDSLYRRGDTAFRVNPRLAGEVWMAYNRRILDFVREHPEQAAVIRAENVVAERELEHARHVSAALADRAEQAEQDLRHERQAATALAERAEQAERELDRARQAVAALVPRAEAAEAERAALVAQVEAERGIYEALRQDLTARIETLRARGRQAA